ncbi:MAG TPA: ribose 5-phosphate isomerase B [Acidimicrobiales bacterium]|nr:ribose 5-phosphate isomerase B [Acidimicrobiales bacterium]
MRIAVGSDHAGYDLKAELAKHLADGGHEVVDLGTNSPDVPVDYPKFGVAVGEAVVSGEVEMGLCICGTGIGISIAANKVLGTRAALVHDVTTAGLAREHNDANVMCVGGRTTGVIVATDALDAFLTTSYAGGRHQRRIDEITRYEAVRPTDEASRLTEADEASRPTEADEASRPTERERPTR